MLMKIIIAGSGKVGYALTRQLSSEGYDITVVDKDSDALQNVMEHYDVMAVCGNCATKNILVSAGVSDADLLIAATGEDEVNLLCCAVAHKINPAIHTIARIRNPEYSEQIYGMRDVFALSMAVNPEKQAALEIERLLKYPGFLNRDTFAKGKVEIVELKIEDGSPLCNIPLKKMGEIVKCKVLVCVVLRNGEAIAPDGNFVLSEGDRIFVTAPVNELTALLSGLGIVTKKVKNVIICGGGRIGYYLASRLSRDGFSTKIIESDYKKCTEISAALPDVDVINGDACNHDLLKSEGISECDALVTLTGFDEMNMIISLYGRNKGVKQTVTKLSRLKNSGILGDIPLGSVICPNELCCNTIVQYVRAMKNQTGAALAVHFIADRRAEAIEFRVDDSTLHCGEPLKNLKTKKNVLVACITHGGETEIPSGDSFYQKGDSVIVVTTGGNTIYQLSDIFA